MKPKKLLPALLCAALMVTISCEKEGPAGPAGSQGEQGIQGVAGSEGAKGDKGERGATGTANVIYSDWIPVTLVLIGSDEYPYTFSDDKNRFMKIVDSRMTSEFASTGVVLVYRSRIVHSPFDDYSQGYIQMLPISNEQVKWDVGLYYNLRTHNYNLNIEIHVIDLPGRTAADLIRNTAIRYVLIPGGVHASAEGIDLNKYEEVAKAFNIPK